jgi:hypothetical protein
VRARATVFRAVCVAVVAGVSGCTSLTSTGPNTSFATTHFGPGRPALPASQAPAFAKTSKSPFDLTDDTSGIVVAGHTGNADLTVPTPMPAAMPGRTYRTPESMRRAEPVFPEPLNHVVPGSPRKASGPVLPVAGQEPGPALPVARQESGPALPPAPLPGTVNAPPAEVTPPPAAASPGPAVAKPQPEAPGTAKHGPALGALTGHKAIGAEAAAPVDPHTLPRPTAMGGMLELRPNESAVERAVALAAELEFVKGEKLTLANRLRAMEQILEARERMIREDDAQLAAAAQDVAAARAEILRLRAELDRARVKLKVVEKEDLETLRLVVNALAEYLEGP